MKYLKIFAIALLLIFLTSCTEDENYITSAVVNSEGHLVLTYSDGTTLDQGLVVPEVVDVEVFLVNFYNTEGHIISTQVVEEGEDAFAPILNLTDYVIFDEWDTTFTNVNDDLNVRPVWHEETFTVSFHWTDDPVPDMTGIQYGETIILPEPNIPGMQFLGWYDSDSPYASRMNMQSQINTDMDLYARYEDIVYTVTTHIDEGEFVTQEVFYGEEIEFAIEPTKEDYFFNGWYYDQEEMNPVESVITITEDIDIYVSWIQFEYTFYDHPYAPDDEHIYINGVIGEHNIIHIPSMIDGYEVGRIYIGAFQYNTASEVYLPNTIYNIHSSAFADMPNLTSIVIPDSVTQMGNYIFRNCTSLSDVTLSENATSHGVNTFQNTAIESIIIPEGTINLSNGLFEDTPLATIELPSTLQVIYDYAFRNTQLTSIDIPEGVSHVGYHAFADSLYLESVTLPETMVSIGQLAFTNTPSLTSITLAENNPFFELIEGVLYSENMSRIYMYFEYNTSAAYTVPETVQYLEGRSFYGNPYLELINLPDTLSTSNLYYNFEEMESFEAFNVYDASGTALIASDNGVLYDSDYTILLNYPMGKTDTAYLVHSNTVYIYPYAFMNNSHINSIILPNGLIRIYSNAFKNCINLSAINFPTTLTTISDSAFQNVNGLTQIDLPASVNTIGNGAFSDMDNLTTLNLNEGLLVIAGYIIQNSNNVTSLHIPSTVYSLYNNALTGSNGLSTVTVAATNPDYISYYNVIYTTDYRYLVAYPGGLTQNLLTTHPSTLYVVADFGTNPYLQIIVCRSNVEVMDGNIYELPNLDAVILQRPSSSGLVNMYYKPNAEHPFTVYVQDSSLEDYRLDNNWKDYIEYIRSY